MSVWQRQVHPALTEIRSAAISFREWLHGNIAGAAAADCELALVEACNNLVLHNPGSTAPIQLRAIFNPWQVTLWIEDYTNGFEWPKAPKMPPPEAESGRGIVLIHSLMTEITYHRLSGRNELCLRRNLDPCGETSDNDSGRG